jgi:uncharacterized membrane protein YcaP (DUF421 family)
MEIIYKFFGQGKDLSIIQMVMRGVAVFVIAFVLIRIAGRRSFGIRTPMDMIINILLGAILSRAVVGASPFLAVVICCLAIVILHRMMEWLLANHDKSARLLEGNKIELYSMGTFKRDNMKKALVCEEDILQGIRKTALTEDLSKIDKVYMERNGEITSVKKTIEPG